MKAIFLAVALVAGLAVGLLSFAPALPVTKATAQHELPGMCNGRSDANTVVNAHANGQPNAVPKYILNLSSDSLGEITGTLVLGKGPDRLQVVEWCRLWQHIAGDPYGGHGGECDEGGGEGEDHGSTNLHAVGLTTFHGDRVLVRTDVRENDEGKFFRVRYRVLGDHGEDDCGDEGGCEEVTVEEEPCEGGWTRIPAEGWLPLDQLKVRQTTPAP
jgi:hypothetical protein